jgi:hypothetical protein
LHETHTFISPIKVAGFWLIAPASTRNGVIEHSHGLLGKRKAPRQNMRGAVNPSGLFSSFLRGASHLKSPRRWLLKEQNEKPCAKSSQGFENSPAI